MENCLSIIADSITIIVGLLAIAAYFGIRDKLSYERMKKIKYAKAIIEKNKDSEFVTFRSNKDAPWLDRDYLKIDSKLYWIANAETLEYVCKYNINATLHPDKKTNFITERELVNTIKGETLNIKID